MNTKLYCSLEQAKKLKQLGIVQQAQFSWFGDEQIFNETKNGVIKHVWIASTKPVNNMDADRREDTCTTEPIAAAFSVGELGLLLADEYRLPEKTGNTWQEPFQYSEHPTEAEARAVLLIALIEDNRVTVTSINQRYLNDTNTD